MLDTLDAHCHVPFTNCQEARLGLVQAGRVGDRGLTLTVPCSIA